MGELYTPCAARPAPHALVGLAPDAVSPHAARRAVRHRRGRL